MKGKLARILAVAALGALPVGATQATASPSYYSGYLILNLQIYMTTAVPSGDTVGCELSVSVTDNSVTNAITEYGYATASGSTGTVTCTVQVPYYWSVLTPTADTIYMSTTATIYNPNATQNPTKVRSTSQALPAISGIPQSGTHSEIYAAVRL